MNFVFIGTTKFGLRCLRVCTEVPDVKVVGVVTGQQKFRISYSPDGITNVLYADIAEFARERSIPCATVERSMNDPGLIDVVRAWNPDSFIVAGWYHMVPRTWRVVAPAYGLHASLLPDYSGGAPLVWAMINGETKTGITLFQMDDGVDSGPIAGQRQEPILPNDTIATLYERIEARGIELLQEALPQLVCGTIKLYPQDETKRRVMPQRSPRDGLIDWTNDAVSIDRFIRAQTRPYPGAFSILDGKPLTIWTGRSVARCDSRVMGLVEKTAAKVYTVSCASGGIELGEVAYEHRTYVGESLADLFGRGGQRLGASRNCSRS